MPGIFEKLRRFLADLVERFLEDRLCAFPLSCQNDDDVLTEFWNKHADRVSLLQNACLSVNSIMVTSLKE